MIDGGDIDVSFGSFLLAFLAAVFVFGLGVIVGAASMGVGCQ